MEDLLFFYQNLPSKVSPIIFSIGNFGIRWYSIGYILALITFLILAKYRIRHQELNFPITSEEIDSFSLWLLLGAVLGGRLGYVIFYNPGYYLFHLWEVILPIRFQNGIQFVGISGLSYHGGFLGFVFVGYLYARKKKIQIFKMLDFLASIFPLGYTFGRLGNFMNGELYGRITEVPWGMYFLDKQGIPFEELRHPSQLYEAFSEGILLFLIVWFLRNRVPTGVLTGVYIMGYGLIRFIIEFFRQPDAIFKNPGDELGTVLWTFTMGQVLSIFMILIGLSLIISRLSSSNTKNNL